MILMGETAQANDVLLSKSPQIDLGAVVSSNVLPDKLGRFSHILPEYIRVTLAAADALGFQDPLLSGFRRAVFPYIRGVKGDAVSMQTAVELLYDILQNADPKSAMYQQAKLFYEDAVAHSERSRGNGHRVGDYGPDVMADFYGVFPR